MLEVVSGTNGELRVAAAAEQLDRVLSSATFRNAPRLSEFLRFTAQATLRGEAGQIKEYVVGVEVFGRGDSYDPRVDPVVRVEARRLRAKLREYYEEEGRQDPIRIGLPKGGYVPVFETVAATGAKQPRFALRGSLLLWIAAAAVVAAMLVKFGWIPNSSPAAGRESAAALPVNQHPAGEKTTAPEALNGRNAAEAVAPAGEAKPGGSQPVSPAPARLAVLPMRAYAPTESAESQRLSDALTEGVLRQLSPERSLSLVSWPTAAGYRAEGKDMRQIGSDLGVELVAAIWVRESPQKLMVSVHIVDAANDRKLWADGYEVPRENAAAPEDLSRKIAAQILDAVKRPAPR